MENELLTELEQKIGYQFKDKGLLKHAMSHSSYANERHMGKLKSNERLEFLGDAVLELVTSEYLSIHIQPCQKVMLQKCVPALYASRLWHSVQKRSRWGTIFCWAEVKRSAGGRTRASITSDACEALIGAIYLDGGFTSAKEFICKFILNDLEHKKLFFDSKTILQERVQAHHDKVLHYELVGEEGPDHQKLFVVEARLGEKVIGRGKGGQRKPLNRKQPTMRVRAGKLEQEKNACI